MNKIYTHMKPWIKKMTMSHGDVCQNVAFHLGFNFRKISTNNGDISIKRKILKLITCASSCLCTNITCSAVAGHILAQSVQ